MYKSIHKYIFYMVYRVNYTNYLNNNCEMETNNKKTRVYSMWQRYHFPDQLYRVRKYALSVMYDR